MAGRKTVDADIHDNVIASAAREALRRRAGLAAIADWERQHGHFTEQEIKRARRKSHDTTA